MDTCSAPDCPLPTFATGLCGAHYSRLRRTGSLGVKPIARYDLPFEERLAANVVITGFCWLWVGPNDGRGYGKVVRSKRAHVWVYENLVGPVPDGLELDHLCRIKACCNPDHVEPVTHRENMRRWYALHHC